jgi:hypothetical protein
VGQEDVTGAGVIVLLVFFFLVVLGLGARIGGVRLSFWKLVVFVTACIVVVGVLVTALAK